MMKAKQFDKYGDYVYPLVRIIVGFLFACHGAQKLFGVLGSQPEIHDPEGLVAGLFFACRSCGRLRPDDGQVETRTYLAKVCGDALGRDVKPEASRANEFGVALVHFQLPHQTWALRVLPKSRRMRSTKSLGGLERTVRNLLSLFIFQVNLPNFQDVEVVIHGGESDVVTGLGQGDSERTARCAA